MPNYLLVAGGTIVGGQPWSIRSYAVAPGTESATAATWDAAFQALWSSSGWVALLPTSTILTFTYASTMSANFKQTTKTQTGHSIAGTSASAPLPPQLAIIATLRTALSNKAGHGRWYLPAPSAGGLATSGGLWAATTSTALQTALNALGTALGSSITLQLLHRNPTRSGLAALSLTPVTGGDTSNKPAIQRRRGDKIVPTRINWTP